MTWNPRDALQEWQGFTPESLRQKQGPRGKPAPEAFVVGRPEALPTVEADFILGQAREEGEATLEAILAGEGMPPPRAWDRWRQMIFRGYPDLGAGMGVGRGLDT